MSKGPGFSTVMVLFCTLVSSILLATMPKIEIKTDPDTYSAETNQQVILQREPLSGQTAYFTASGSKYHLYDDCISIAGKEIFASDMIFAGSGGKTLCSLCQTRAAKEESRKPGKTDSPPADKENQTFYRTPSGEKYHADPDCRHLKNRTEILPLSFSEAEAAGLSPCSDCVQ